MFKRSLAIGVLFSLLTVTGLGCKGNENAAIPAALMKPVVLQYWGVFTDSDDMNVLIKGFNAKHPSIQIQYRKFRPEEYEQKLVEAFAEDRGPDLFTIHNDWLKNYYNKLSPMPASMKYAVFTTTGSAMKQETSITLAEHTGLTVKQMRDQFVHVVEADAMANESATSSKKAVFALPFYVDSLAMYYNKDLLAQNGLTAPATDWETVRLQAEKYTKPQDSDLRRQGISQSIVGMGTGANVHSSPDLLAALMMQSGAPVTLDNGQAGFNLRGSSASQGDVLPGVAALQFYLDFSNPDQKSYTWSPESGDALQAFVQGRLAYYFGYSYDLATIRGLNPRLNFDITPLPLPKGVTVPVSVANYWMEGVSRKSLHKDEAWLFILETASGENKDALAKFLKNTKRASALNSVIQTQVEDIDIGVFAKQNLTAKTWYRGRDSGTASTIMIQLIDNTRRGLLSPADNFDANKFVKEQIDNAVSRINNTL